MRKYEIIQTDREDETPIHTGECDFYADDKELAPAGFRLDIVQNTPAKKIIYVKTSD